MNAVLGVGDKLALESRLFDVRNAVTQAAGCEANRSLTSLPNLISAGVGIGDYARNESPTEAIGRMLAMRVLLSPAALSQLAIRAAQAGRLAKSSLMAGATRVAYVGSLNEETPEEPR